MKKIVYYVATSIDGFIARPDGSVDDFLMEGEHADEFVASFSQFDTVIMGRGTYEFGFQFGLKAGQAAYPGLKHVILSKSLDFESNNEVELVSEHQEAYLRGLLSGPGKDLWLCGGGKVAAFLASLGLIDELRLKVNPVVLGDGIPLFEGLSAPISARLEDVKAYKNGVVLQSYRLR